jgi:hypothetical protein
MIFRERCKVRLFEKRGLRKIFWPKWLKIKGEWIKMFDVELFYLSAH